MSYETILVEQKGAVTLITLNRPQALNALNSQVLAELIDAFAVFDADDGQRCAVLTASARSLSALIWPMHEGVVVNPTAASPETSPTTEGPPPLNGMCSILIPVMLLKSSPARCGPLPVPDDE